MDCGNPGNDGIDANGVPERIKEYSVKRDKETGRVTEIKIKTERGQPVNEKQKAIERESKTKVPGVTKEKTTTTTISVNDGNIKGVAAEEIRYRVNIRDVSMYTGTVVTNSQPLNLAARILLEVAEASLPPGPTVVSPPIPGPVDNTVTDALEKVSVFKEILDVFSQMGGQ